MGDSAVLVERVPITVDDDGAMRVSGTRVLLELVVDEFKRGASPEQIADDYSTLALADVYDVLAYYLRHTDEIDAYIASRKQEGDRIRKVIESKLDSAGLRDGLSRSAKSSVSLLALARGRKF